MADWWDAYPDADESELGAAPKGNWWDAYPDADPRWGNAAVPLRGPFAPVSAAFAPNASTPSIPPSFRGPFQSLLPNGQSLRFGMFGRGPNVSATLPADTIVLTQAPPPLSPEGDALLRRLELNSLTMTPPNARFYGVDPVTHTYTGGDARTFGIGHRIVPNDAPWVAQLQRMSLADQAKKAEELYAQDKQNMFDFARNRVGAQYFDALSQNQKDSLVIAAFNSGERKSAVGPKMVQDIQTGNLADVPNQFDAWNLNGKISGGLVERQLKEQAVWNGKYDYSPDPTRVRDIMRRGRY